MMLQDMWNRMMSSSSSSIAAPTMASRLSQSAPCSPVKPPLRMQSELLHAEHKIPVGDTPYVKAKRVQLVDKDPDKAIALFWAAINAGDRVDSALKDMAIVMKQQNRAEEAIEAIKSLRNRCSDQAQESLDNILLDLYKRCGRLDDQIALLKHKLLLIQQGMAFNGKRTKTARSQGRKFQVSVDQEATRLLGNLGWALMQQENYSEAEAAYRKALLIGADNNKMCNLGICLMKQGRITEAKETLKKVSPAMADGPRGVDSHLKAFERAQEMLLELESKLPIAAASTVCGIARFQNDKAWIFDPKTLSSPSLWQQQPSTDVLQQQDRIFMNEEDNWSFDPKLLVSGSIWDPQPCGGDSLTLQDHIFADENADVVSMKVRGEAASSISGNSLRIDAPPYYSRFRSSSNSSNPADNQSILDPVCKLKRSRPIVQERLPLGDFMKQQDQKNNRRRSLTFEDAPISSPAARWKDLLPDNKAFDEAIVAAVLSPVLEAAAAVADGKEGAAKNGKTAESPLVVRKRLKVFEEITYPLLSPSASKGMLVGR